MPTISGWATGEPVPAADINTYLLRGNRNAIINGDMRINQRGVTSATDDIYALDRWTVLSDAATITVAQSTVAPTDGLYSFSLTPSTTNKKFGIIQFLEQRDCVGMFGQTVTLSFKAKVSGTTNFDNVKAGILSWSGTADTLTSDVVSAWGAEGTNPTLVSNWTFENTPSNLGVTTSWATYRVQGVIDTASAKNVAVFIWSDVTVNSASDVLYITDVQLEIGAIATPFERRSTEQEMALCHRYYWKSYRYATAPGANTDFQSAVMIAGSDAGASVYVSQYFTFNSAMRAIPTISYWDVAGNASRLTTVTVGGLVRTDNQNLTIFFYPNETGLGILCAPGVGLIPLVCAVANIEL